ncbi:MAG: HAMP domain-containing histidine kinase [Clostridiales bacterium]|nr:HAMP domain-containing histidine kinase [Clostridiales bacterium]
MDIKSKKSNRKYNKALLTGIIITIFTSALFVAFFPYFSRQAAQFRAREGKETLENEAFVSLLFRCNYVLYKDVMDKGGNRDGAIEELYDTIIKDADENTVDYNAVEEYKQYNLDWQDSTTTVADIDELNNIISYYSDMVKCKIDDMRVNIMADIGILMDYYVLDKSTGAGIKNTSLPIDELLRVKGYAGNANENGNSDSDGKETPAIENIESLYDYYVIMDYDSLGNLQNISVKGQEPDKLLKLVRSLDGSSNTRLMRSESETVTYDLYDWDKEKVTKQLTFVQKKPADTVFVYALTSEQMELIKSGKDGYIGYYNLGSSTINAVLPISTAFSFHWSSAENLYLVILLGIFAITFILAIFCPVMLEGKRERKAPFEIMAIIALFFIAFSYGDDQVIYFVAWIERTEAYLWGDIKYAAAFGVMALVFGLWYFLCLEVSDIMRGFKQYLQTRCLIYKCFRKAFLYIKSGYAKFRAEIAGADLEEGVDKQIKKLVIINCCLLCVILWFWGFGIPIIIIYSLALYYLIKKYIGKVRMQYKNLLNAIGSIADGNLNNTFEEDFGVFESSKKELYEIQNGFKNAVDKEVKSQMMKTELITNVSHDLKTPLTAIITYIDLMKNENITEEQRKVYLATLEQKSLRLKVLIEDLFEVSRANSGNINLEPVPVDICNLVRQAYLENEDKIKEAGLQVRFTMPDEKVILQLDSQKTYRIFENLYGNIIKYALHDTRVFVSAQKLLYNEREGSVIRIEIKNISAQELEGDAQYLSERFVRGDSSRNTEGSGLGLAIARSFTELQGGTFKIEIDGDLFKVILEWGI